MTTPPRNPDHLNLVTKLEKNKELRGKIASLCANYIRAGSQLTTYWTSSYDVAGDLWNCYRQLTKADKELADRGAPGLYIQPQAATQIDTMSSWLTTVLFGSEMPIEISGRNPEDEKKADVMQQLISWDNDQQPAGWYQLGKFAIDNALLYNKGIQYEYWKPIIKPKFEQKTKVTPEKREVIIEDGREIVLITPEKQEKVTVKVKETIGYYNHIEVISPYEFIQDPGFPTYRFQEGRYVGHATRISWVDLLTKSKLDKSDPDYVFPEALPALKNKDTQGKGVNLLNPLFAKRTGKQYTSRSALERGTETGFISDKTDKGIVTVTELWVKTSQKELGVGESTDISTFRIRVGGNVQLLSIEESTYLHDQFPYSVAEARPSSLYPTSPSFMMLLKPIQDQVDFLKDKHQESLARTVGNFFFYRSQFFDGESFSQDKSNSAFPLNANVPIGMAIDDIIKQVPISDMTANFPAEMAQLMSWSELVTATPSSMQGDQQTDMAATQYVGNVEMAQGRLMTIARNIAQQLLIPQAKRRISNFQQNLTEPLLVKITGKNIEYRPQFLRENPNGFLAVDFDTIQGDFDFKVGDLTMPGANQRKVAAAIRTLESAPQFPQLFDPTVAGNLDLRSMFLYTLKLGGLPIDNFIIDEQEAQNYAQIAASKAPSMDDKMVRAIAQLINSLKPESIQEIPEVVAYIKQNLGISKPEQLPVDGEQPQAPEQQNVTDGMGNTMPDLSIKSLDTPPSPQNS